MSGPPSCLWGGLNIFVWRKKKEIVPSWENVSTRKHKSMCSMPYANVPQSSVLTH